MTGVRVDDDDVDDLRRITLLSPPSTQSTGGTGGRGEVEYGRGRGKPNETRGIAGLFCRTCGPSSRLRRLIFCNDADLMADNYAGLIQGLNRSRRMVMRLVPQDELLDEEEIQALEQQTLQAERARAAEED